SSTTRRTVTLHRLRRTSWISTSSPFLCFFFFNDTATTEIYTLSLHDALPILASCLWVRLYWGELVTLRGRGRSEEHTSELQSLTNLVCRLLLEKKKLHTTQLLAISHLHMRLTNLIIPRLP